ncbi:unnamed protein product [Periconia digitata]|uniref:H-type lectin domain-containing protein n=1 Tax=Periconia digitata TaxID=1303443 RepID=A0A9W4XH32_9PLEO|nr:unnamed protein product [Periconia digitata]
MALQLVPYNNSMRLGQGFNSFTQQICVDNSVIGISDREDSQPITPEDYIPIAGPDVPASVVSPPNKKPIQEIIDAGDGTTIVRYPSQIVTYSSKYVSKLSDVSNDLNISGSLSIKYGEISGGGSGSYVNTETFQSSDINFLVTVKVINQTINVKDQLQFWPLQGKSAGSYDSKSFTDIYGDSFISGFQEGGQFSAIVSIKALDQSNLTDIKANAHLALQVGVGSVEATADVNLNKKNLNKSSEVNITVNWSGGGQLKESDKPWTIDTLQEVAAKFPDLVANVPQRTHAILTKYTALRGYLQWRASNPLQPLDYEVASLYTSELLDVYMGYKSIWKEIHEMLQDLDGDDDYLHALMKAPELKNPIRMPQTWDAANNKWVDGPVLDRYEPTFEGLDLALRNCRKSMVRIVAENDAISNNPAFAVDVNRPIAYLRPQIFRLLLPVHAPAAPLNVNLVSGNIPFGEGGGEGALGGYANQTVPPDVVLGFTKVDLARVDVLSGSTRQIARLFITQKLANTHKYIATSTAADKSASTRNFGFGTTSLMAPINDEGVQGGAWSMPTRPPGTGAEPSYFVMRQRINFRDSYDNQPPSVVVFLTGFDIGSNGFVNAVVSAEAVDKAGFTVVVTALDSVRTIDVSWFACPADAPNIICGTSDAPWEKSPIIGLAGLKAQESYSGHVGFKNRAFKSPPRIFLALRGFVVGNTTENIRLQVDSADVTKKGFNWKVGCWADTKLLGGVASWIAWV